MERVLALASQRAVVVFSSSSCSMGYVIERLFCDLGVSITVHELDANPAGREMTLALINLMGRSQPLPAVFINGQLIGSTDAVMSLHIMGSLIPKLIDAGAIFLDPNSHRRGALWI